MTDPDRQRLVIYRDDAASVRELAQALASSAGIAALLEYIRDTRPATPERETLFQSMNAKTAATRDRIQMERERIRTDTAIAELDELGLNIAMGALVAEMVSQKTSQPGSHGLTLALGPAVAGLAVLTFNEEGRTAQRRAVLAIAAIAMRLYLEGDAKFLPRATLSDETEAVRHG